MKKFLTLLISLVLLLQPGLASMNGASAQVRGGEHQSLDAVTHFVKPVATGTGTCASWVDACELQTALGIAVSSDEIWVQAGMYMPTTGADRAATFSLKSGVALYGGFLGTETNREQRDWAANVTALSGDIGVVGDSSDNSYNVVTGSGTDATAILDGFTITLGNANGANPFDCGGGMYNNNGNPTLTNVTFSGNTAIDGGGMFNLNGSSPSLANVVFSANSAYYGYGLGGGMTNLEHSNPSLTGVAFRDNTANDGGGMYNDSSDPTITNAIFNTNSASGAGGGMFNYSSSPTMVNVTFSDNTGRSNGGGMFNDTSSPRVTEVAFHRNLADSGGGMYIDGGEPVLVDVAFEANHAGVAGGGMCTYGGARPILTDVIFSGNTAIYRGGGISDYDSHAILKNVTFTGNSAMGKHGGGGMWTSYSNPTLTDVTFSGNSGTNGGGVRSYHSSPMLVNVAFILNRATNYGGGLYIEYWSVPTLVNVTIAGNTAARGGGIETHRSTITVTNTIVWGNSPMLDQFYKASGWPVVSYSDIQGGCPGGTTCTQVIDSDPLFVDAAGGDLRVQPASPAIDAGDNAAVPIGVTTDLLGYPRFVDIASVVDTGNGSPPIVDMGAYEAQIVVYLPILSQ